MRRGPSRRSPRPRAPIGQGPQRGVFWSWYLRFAPGAAVAWRGCAGRAARISGVGPSRAVCPEPRAGGRWREWVGLQVARLEDLGVGRDDGRGAPGRPPSGEWPRAFPSRAWCAPCSRVSDGSRCPSPSLWPGAAEDLVILQPFHVARCPLTSRGRDEPPRRESCTPGFPVASATARVRDEQFCLPIVWNDGRKDEASLSSCL